MNDRLTRSRKARSYHFVNTPRPLWICVSGTKLHQSIKATGRRSLVAGLESAVVASSNVQPLNCMLPHRAPGLQHKPLWELGSWIELQGNFRRLSDISGYPYVVTGLRDMK